MLHTAERLFEVDEVMAEILLVCFSIKSLMVNVCSVVLVFGRKFACSYDSSFAFDSAFL